VLEESKVQIGVVSGIVSLKRWKCVVAGFANHAGTTPMNHRKDALAAAAKHLLAVRDVVRAEPGTQVGTVGYVRAEPGAPNVIPGRVEFPVELRDLDAGKIERMSQQIQQKFAQVDKEEGVETSCEVINDIAASPSDPSVQSVIREAARSAGLSTLNMPSGAVHDAGEISKIAPMGMIFVPSRDGISHSPQEFTSWEDCANGVEVLYRSILLLDRRLQAN
jgi:N-carbamoyl-L-amino-acid hydrolase